MKKAKMSFETKENIKNLFGQLISNNRAIEGARHYGWWVAVIFFVISLIIAVLPTFVSTLNAYGSSIFASKAYNMDIQSAYLFDKVYTDSVDLHVDNNGNLVSSNWSVKFPNQYYKINENDDQYDFVTFVVTDESVDINQIITDLKAAQYRVDSHETATSDDEKKYTPSFMILAPKNFYLQIYYPDTTTAYSGLTGDYQNLKDFNFKDITKDCVHHGEITKYVDDTKLCFDNFKIFLDKGYLNLKNQNILFRNGISLGVYALLGIFMGFMIWLLTRGKHSLLRHYTYWECTKIAAWLMLSPSILGMILGFILPAYAIMFFILFYGVRIMWCSMRQLRPAPNR